MGYTTDFIGHITISPPLNTTEQHYLTAFAMSRRCLRPGGPYDVPGNPAADPEDFDGRNTVAEGQPGFWCQWSVGWDGEALSHDGTEKVYGATEWLRYLIDHFLAPGAYARTSELSHFTRFTFDHELNGIIAANRRDTGRLYLIEVEQNRVSETTLVAGESEWPEVPLLPYERARDQEDERRTRRRRSAR